MKAWGPVLASANADWKFANANGLEYYRPLGWSSVVTRPFFEEARQLNRAVRNDWILRMLSSMSAAFRMKLANMVVYGVMKPFSA